jgi:hypothetical protein
MMNFLVVPYRSQKVQIRNFTLEKETSCTYQKEEKLKQREIQE